MNWFKFISSLINIGSGVADQFIKNTDNQKTKANVMAVVAITLPIVSAIVEGLANQNPDGTPAGTVYNGPTASVKDHVIPSIEVKSN